ncbi:MAG: hypothetical protein WCS65_11945 [Verrucomicrobiae bacterium]
MPQAKPMAAWEGLTRRGPQEAQLVAWREMARRQLEPTLPQLPAEWKLLASLVPTAASELLASLVPTAASELLASLVPTAASESPRQEGQKEGGASSPMESQGLVRQEPAPASAED